MSSGQEKWSLMKHQQVWSIPTTLGVQGQMVSGESFSREEIDLESSGLTQTLEKDSTKI